MSGPSTVTADEKEKEAKADLKRVIDECAAALQTVKGTERTEIFERMGDAYVKMNKLQKAIEFYKGAIDAGGKKVEIFDKAVQTLSQLNRGQEALNILEDGLSKVTTTLDKARLYILMSQVKGRHFMFEGGKRNAETAVRLLQMLEMNDDEVVRVHGAACNALASNLYSMGKFEEARVSYELAMAHYRKVNDTDNYVRNLTSLGGIMDLMGEPKGALVVLEQAMDEAKRSDKKILQSWVANNMGMSYAELGDFKKAEETLLISMTLSKESDQMHVISLLNLNMADLYLEKGDYANAKKWGSRALADLRHAGDDIRSAWVLSALSRVSIAEKDIPHAEKLIKDAMKILEGKQARITEARVIRTVGLVHAAKNDHANAVRYLRKSIEMCKLMGFAAEEARGRGNLALVLKGSGQIKEAAKEAADARRIFLKIGAIHEIKKLDDAGM